MYYCTSYLFFFFFFNDTATTEIYTLSLHDALPICVLSAFFQAHGWGTVTVALLGSAALSVDSEDWVEAEPGSAETPMCFFSAGVLSGFFGRLSGGAGAVVGGGGRPQDHARCRFLSASPGP